MEQLAQRKLRPSLEEEDYLPGTNDPGWDDYDDDDEEYDDEDEEVAHDFIFNLSH